MKVLTLVFSLFFSLQLQAQFSYADLHDQSGGITNGYGSWGAYNVVQEDEIIVSSKGTITCYHPDIAAVQKPTVFFISGWGRPAHTYEKIFHFIASQGYTVVNIYNTDPGNIVESYQHSLDMILSAKSTHFPNWINTHKVGLMGHSYGAGSTIWLGKHIFGADYNWGENGRFIFMSAPWYSLLVTEDDLINYPSDVKLLIEINNDDFTTNPDYTWNTDERAIRGVFELINIPNDEKDFIRVYSDAITFDYDSDGDGVTETYSYDASHYLSYTGIQLTDFHTWDALDVFAINRLSHALLDYVFEENPSAKNVALGNGSTAQTNMGFLTDLAVSDTPIITKPESDFTYKCHDTWNDFSDNTNTWFLQNTCDDSDGDGVIDIITTALKEEKTLSFSLYPIPTTDYLQIRFNGNSQEIQQLEIRDITGKLLQKITYPNSYTITTSNFDTGTYYIKITTSSQVGIQSFIVLK